MPLKNGKLSEADAQTMLFEWAAYIPELKYLFHIPNGGSRNRLEALNLKRQGVRAGVPDIMLPLPKGHFAGLFIELKVKPNKPTEKQLEWIKYLDSVGYCAKVCYGFDEAREVIENYLALD